MLTKKERAEARVKILAGMLEGKNMREAIVAAGLDISRGTNIVHTLRDHLAVVLEDEGLTNTSIVREYLRPALDATETQFFSKDGIVCDERTIINWQARLNALNVLLRLKGSYHRDVEDNEDADTSRGIQVNIQVIGQDVKVDT